MRYRRLFHFLFIWLILFSFFLLLDNQYKQQKIEILQRKNKLIRLNNSKLQWHLNRTWAIRPELDALRWYWQATALQHRDWAQIIDTIYRKAKEYGLRPDLVLAIAHRESNFVPFAQSPFAAGIMQINWSVWAEPLGLDMTTIFDIENNVDAGCFILRQYLNETNGDEIRALELYNCGYKLQNPSYVPRIKSSKFYGGSK